MCDEQQQERPGEIPVKFSIWDPVLREKGHAGQPAATVAALEVCPAADDTAFGCVEGLRVPGNLTGVVSYSQPESYFHPSNSGPRLQPVLRQRDEQVADFNFANLPHLLAICSLPAKYEFDF